MPCYKARLRRVRQPDSVFQARLRGRRHKASGFAGGYLLHHTAKARDAVALVAEPEVQVGVRARVSGFRQMQSSLPWKYARQPAAQKRNHDQHNCQDAEVGLCTGVHEVRNIRINQERYQPPQSEKESNASDGEDRSNRHNSDLPLHGSPFKGMPLAPGLHWHHDPFFQVQTISPSGRQHKCGRHIVRQPGSPRKDRPGM